MIVERPRENMRPMEIGRRPAHISLRVTLLMVISNPLLSLERSAYGGVNSLADRADLGPTIESPAELLTLVAPVQVPDVPLSRTRPVRRRYEEARAMYE